MSLSPDRLLAILEAQNEIAATPLELETVRLLSGMIAAATAHSLERAAADRAMEERTLQLRHALAEVEVANAEIVRRLSMAIEFRDEDTGAHTERIGRLAGIIAAAAGLDLDFCDQLRRAAALHDAGKVAIPDSVLLKPGRFTPEERTIIETHAEHGYRLLRGSTSDLLDLAATIAWTHHERWDGAGYPRGLAGTEIPLESRIVAIADVYDALTSDRVYRKAMSLEQALEIMRSERGKHFDPAMLDVFMGVLETGYQPARNTTSDAGQLDGSVFETYVAALAKGDAHDAQRIIADALAVGWEMPALYSEIIGPAMAAIGGLWETGRIGVSGEHLASGITKNILARLAFQAAPIAASSGRRVLLATTPDDHHTIGLQMAADVFDAAGWHTSVLDADLPVEAIIERARGVRPELIALAVTLPGAVPALRRAVTALRDALPNLPLLIGGPVAPADLDGPGVRVVSRADQIIEYAECLLGSERSIPPAQPAIALAAGPVGGGQ